MHPQSDWYFSWLTGSRRLSRARTRTLKVRLSGAPTETGSGVATSTPERYQRTFSSVLLKPKAQICNNSDQKAPSRRQEIGFGVYDQKEKNLIISTPKKEQSHTDGLLFIYSWSAGQPCPSLPGEAASPVRDQTVGCSMGTSSSSIICYQRRQK